MLNVFRALRRPSRRAPALPANLPLVLQPGERPLAWASDGQGIWYVGTSRAVHICAPGNCRRLPWETVERAEWDREAEQLEVVELAEFGTAKPAHRATLRHPERLLQLVRERVTASVVVTHFVAVQGKRGVTVVGRRAPHTDDPLLWSVVVDRRLDETAPAVIAAAEQGLAQARAEVGET